MKHLLVILWICLTLPAHAEFYSGNDLYKRLQSTNAVDQGLALGYIAGAFDTLSSRLICPPSNVTMGQVRDIVRMWLENNPQTRHFSADSLVLSTFKSVWPCDSTVSPSSNSQTL